MVSDTPIEIDRLFTEHADELYRYLKTFRLGDEESYDLVQTAFEKLLNKGLNGIEAPKAWLFTVGRNLAIDAYNRLKRHSFQSDWEQMEDTTSNSLNTLLKNERNAALWRIFNRLTDEEKELFRLHVDQGFSYAEMAGILSKSEGALRVQVHRAREKMKAYLEQELADRRNEG